MSTGSYSKYFGGGLWNSHGEYMHHKNEKIKQLLRDETGDNRISAIFEGCILSIDGRTNVTDFTLKRMIVQHGGEYEPYDLRRVTHIIADNIALGNQRWLHYKYVYFFDEASAWR